MKKAKLDKQLATYSTAAGAVLLGASAAEGSIVANTGLDITVGSGSTYLDLNADLTSDFTLNVSAISSASFGQAFITGSGAMGTFSVNNLSYGATISSGKSWNAGQGRLFSCPTSWGLAGGNFESQPGYIGVKFNSGDGDKYGWIHIDSIAGNHSSYHIDGYAYEDNGGSIPAGAIPEPSSLVLLAAGAAGMYGIRRRLMI